MSPNTSTPVIFRSIAINDKLAGSSLVLKFVKFNL